MPDDGHRYELLDGVLVASPSPARRHQRAVLRLARLLDDSLPADLEVLIAPFDVALAVDPDEPSVTAWALDDAGTYAEVGHAAGDEVLEAAVPIPFRVTPRSSWPSAPDVRP